MRTTTQHSMRGRILIMVLLLSVVLTPLRSSAALVPVAEGGGNLFTNISNTIETIWSTTKEAGLDAVAWGMGRAALNQITANTLDWVGTGFEGDPVFVSNPQDFLQNTVDAQFNDYVGSYMQESNQPYVYKQLIAKMLIDDHYRGRRTNANSDQYTLDQYFETDADRQRFLEGDFSRGGWDAFHELTQNPDNNPFGSYLKSKAQARKQAQDRRESEEQKLAWGDGFRSIQDCAEKDNIGNCLVQGAIQTPGKIIQNQLSETLSSPLRQLETADEFNEILSTAVGTMLNSVMSPGGLTGGGEQYNNSVADVLRDAENVVGTSSNDIIEGQDTSNPTEEEQEGIPDARGTTTPPNN